MNRSASWRVAVIALAIPVVMLAGYPASASSAHWEISGCRLDKSSSPALYANVTVKNLDPNNEHDYWFDVQFSYGKNRLGTGTVAIHSVRPLEEGVSDGNNAIVSNPSSSVSRVPEGNVKCRITKVLDDSNAIVTRK